MKLKDYLKQQNISKTDFAKKIDINRMTLHKFLEHPEESTLIFRLAMEYLTAGEVTRNDWNKD